MTLRERQEGRSSVRKYVVRVCRGGCVRYLPQQTLQVLNELL
jgi:hypothetical protein